MVYNNAKLWTRHANQHQKSVVVFFNKGCQGHITLFNTLREKIPFQIPPSVSICLHFVGVLVMAQSEIAPFDKNTVVSATNHVWKKKHDVKKTRETQDPITCVRLAK